MMESTNGPVRMVPKTERSELAESVDLEERDLPEMKRHYAVRAVQYRSFFDALLAQDFTRDEALRLTESEFME